MLHIIPAAEIGPRAKAVNLSMKSLARMASVYERAPQRLGDGKRVRFDIHQALSDALLKEEARIRAHLAGVPAQNGG